MKDDNKIWTITHIIIAIAIEYNPTLSIKYPITIGTTNDIMVFNTLDTDIKRVRLSFLLSSDCKEFAPIQKTTSEKALHIAIKGTKCMIYS